MDFTPIPEPALYNNVDCWSMSKVQLPLPDNYYSMLLSASGLYFCQNTVDNCGNDYKQLVASFVSNMLNTACLTTPASDSGMHCPMQVNTSQVLSLNCLTSSMARNELPLECASENLNENYETENKLASGVSSPRLATQHSTLSELSACEENQPQSGCKVPKKEDLYQLSTLIQNTNPEFENFVTGDVSMHVDKFEITQSGLYVSKNINGFEWAFEVYFEKNSKTSRNRRMLRCKHEHCNKVFKKAWNLFDHMRIHTGEKPYSCNQCGRRFAQNGNLTKHLKLHNKRDRKVHSCGVCGKKYTEKFNLTVHLKNKHGQVFSEYSE